MPELLSLFVNAETRKVSCLAGKNNDFWKSRSVDFSRFSSEGFRRLVRDRISWGSKLLTVSIALTLFFFLGPRSFWTAGNDFFNNSTHYSILTVFVHLHSEAFLQPTSRTPVPSSFVYRTIIVPSWKKLISISTVYHLRHLTDAIIFDIPSYARKSNVNNFNQVEMVNFT